MAETRKTTEKNEKTEAQIMAEQIETLKAEIERLKAGAQVQEVKPEPVDPENDPKRMVTIKLFKDSNRYSQPLFVGVNDYTAYIERGKNVQVPYYVAKHLEEMTEADENTAAMITNLQREYDAQLK